MEIRATNACASTVQSWLAGRKVSRLDAVVAPKPDFVPRPERLGLGASASKTTMSTEEQRLRTSLVKIGQEKQKQVAKQQQHAVGKKGKHLETNVAKKKRKLEEEQEDDNEGRSAMLGKKKRSR